MPHVRNVTPHCDAHATHYLRRHTHHRMSLILYTCGQHRRLAGKGGNRLGLAKVPVGESMTCGALVDFRLAGVVMDDHFGRWLGVGSAAGWVDGRPRWHTWADRLRFVYQGILDGEGGYPSDVVDRIDRAVALVGSREPDEMDEALQQRVLSAVAEAETLFARVVRFPRLP